MAEPRFNMDSLIGDLRGLIGLKPKIAASAEPRPPGPLDKDSLIGDLNNEILIKSNETLKRHLTPKDPPPEMIEIDPMDEPAAPTVKVPEFSGMNANLKWTALCGYIKEVNDDTVNRICEANKENKDEMLIDIAHMVIGNTNLIVGQTNCLNVLKDSFTKLVEAANSDTASIESIKETLNKQSADMIVHFNSLIPATGTATAINLEAHQKILKGEFFTMKDEIIYELRNNRHEMLGAKPKNKHGPGSAGNPSQVRSSVDPTNIPLAPPPPNSWAKVATPPTTTTPTPVQTQHPPQNPSQTTQGEQQSVPNQTVEEFQRPVASTGPNGEHVTEWTMEKGKKKNRGDRNINFRFSDATEKAFKLEKLKEDELKRSRRQILIFNLANPIDGPNRAEEIKNIIKIAHEMTPGWLGLFGFKIQKEELQGAECQRLWNYGGPGWTGPYPLKVTFKEDATASKFTNGAKAGGLLGGRKKVNRGKYQNTPLEEIPSYYIRPGSTFDERQKSKSKKEANIAHKKSAAYTRHTNAVARTKAYTHKVVVDDLDDDFFIDTTEYPPIGANPRPPKKDHLAAGTNNGSISAEESTPNGGDATAGATGGAEGGAAGGATGGGPISADGNGNGTTNNNNSENNSSVTPEKTMKSKEKTTEDDYDDDDEEIDVCHGFGTPKVGEKRKTRSPGSRGQFLPSEKHYKLDPNLTSKELEELEARGDNELIRGQLSDADDDDIDDDDGGENEEEEPVVENEEEKTTDITENL